MLSEEVINKVVNRLVERVQKGNEYVLQKIGENIKKIGTLSSASRRELEQIMQYGGDYDKIVNELSKITNINIKEIKEIFNEVAKSDYEFAEKFYDYRDIKYIPYKENINLQNLVDSMARSTSEKYMNIMNTRLIGFNIYDGNGNYIFKDLRQTFIDTMDEAILNVSQGKETFDEAANRTLQQLSESGLQSVQFESGATRRLDSTINMELRSGIRELHNQLELQIGEEIDADGMEMSVHGNPAPDHADAQGHQFSIIKEKGEKYSEWEKLQIYGHAKDYEGKEIDIRVTSKKGHISWRPISMYNCYHVGFAVVLGVNKPQYSDEELKEINEKNEDGFEFEGKHYTNYEGTQLQRRIETEVRKMKDMQIAAKAGNQSDLVEEAQGKITLLTNKYRNLSQASGLPYATERMRVSGYRRTTTKKVNYINANEDIINKMQNKSDKVFSKFSQSQKETITDYVGKGYENLNYSLNKVKGDFEKLSVNNKLDTKVIDKTMNENFVSENLKVYKGTLDEYYKDIKINDEFELNFYNSTSLKYEKAENFLSDYAISIGPSYKDEVCMLEINTPKNTKSLYIGTNGFTNENELLLDRGLKYKMIKKDKVVYKNQKINKYILEIIK